MAPTVNWDPYERHLLLEVARHQDDKSPLQAGIERLAEPMRWAVSLSRRIPGSAAVRDRVRKAVERAAGTVSDRARRQVTWAQIDQVYRKTGLTVTDWEAVQQLSLPQMDRAARATPAWWGWAALEGGAVGLVQGLTELTVLPWVAMAASDITATLWMGAREAALMAACYGFSPESEETAVHILASMIPVRDWEAVEYTGFKALLGNSGATRQILAQVTDAWTTKMSLTLTEKEVAVVLPLAGAALNASLNAAYLRGIRQSAQDYFRLQRLSERHTPEAVLQGLQAARRHRSLNASGA